jgi:putative component of membrane protein insertase Oxa1/YidC/SpoIIIJ protein YidD
LTITVFSQTEFTEQVNTDWKKWEKAEFQYEKKNHHRHRDYSFEAGSVSGFVAKSLANTYWFLISDLDGDNCPFRPSCSAFFVEAAKETNFLQGILMFADRFTRDYNIYKRHEHYPHVKDGHYYDPASHYTLNSARIKYIPPSVTVNR